MERLCSLYHPPVLAYFQSHVTEKADAEDLTQELFRQFLHHKTWLRFDASKGRFRHFLLCIAGSALKNWNRNRGALKRGGGQPLQSFDLLVDAGLEPEAPPDGGELAFDREWARTVVAEAWRLMEVAAARSSKRTARFAVLRRFLPGGEAPPTYADAAAALSTSVGHVKAYVHRLREEFRGNVRWLIAATVPSSAEVTGEMAHLCAVMSAGHVPDPQPGGDSLSHSPADGLF